MIGIGFEIISVKKKEKHLKRCISFSFLVDTHFKQSFKMECMQKCKFHEKKKKKKKKKIPELSSNDLAQYLDGWLVG